MVLPRIQVTAVRSSPRLRLHTLLIRTSGRVPSHHHSSSSHLLDHHPRLSCHPEYHHRSLQWRREGLLLKCSIPPFLLSTLHNKVRHQACPYLLVLMDRALCRDSPVLHPLLISLQTEVLPHPSHHHHPVTLITGFLLHPSSQEPGAPLHLSTVTAGLNPRWWTHLGDLQNSITKTLVISSSTWTRIQTLSICLKRALHQVRPTGDLQLISMRTGEVHFPVGR